MKKTILTASTTAAVVGLAAATASDAHAAKEGMEKCYGVVKAGKNDCGSKDGSHACAGMAPVDSDSNEWLYLPEGVCDKLTGGITDSKE